MRFARVIAGILLLTTGIPVLLVGGALWTAGQHRDTSGAFSAQFEPVKVSGHAMVVADLGELLRRAVPVTAPDATHLRLTARTADGAPAFLGLAPTDTVSRYLSGAPHASVSQLTFGRGPLPVRLAEVVPANLVLPGPGAATAAAPVAQRFWVRDGLGAVEWTLADLRNEPLSLVVMRPDGRPELAVELRAELRSGWFDPAMWGALASGLLLVLFGVAVLLRPPPRPREVVFVVEPEQVPILADRLGVTALSAVGTVAPEQESPATAGLRPIGTSPSVTALHPVPQPALRPAPSSGLRPELPPVMAGASARPAVTGGEPAWELWSAGEAEVRSDHSS